ncbi:MAG TPA: alpha/beta hydrolase [Candidatus Saccharimonadales bacterium]|nr:alpha/beta hydrolase [Candidatus Saccharimonadales bacterium]
MDNFSAQYIETGEARIFIKKAGTGLPLLLLHGFPETHYMWRRLAPLLAQKFTVVVADLRGYGESSCPPSKDDHSTYSKRAMARDMVVVMKQLGFSKFSIIGHDRGARVAYRMALDYPNVATELVVCDIVPTGIAWKKADSRMMLGFWPWAMLAQPAPLPEHILKTNAAAIINNACDQWGSSAETFSSETRDVYIRALSDSQHIHAICEEYRAAATIDRLHDEDDLQAERTITCPTLVLWGAGGALDTWYQEDGGPLTLWKKLAPYAVGESMPGGHFFPEELPEKTYEKLESFLTSQ